MRLPPPSPPSPGPEMLASTMAMGTLAEAGPATARASDKAVPTNSARALMVLLLRPPCLWYTPSAAEVPSSAHGLGDPDGLLHREGGFQPEGHLAHLPQQRVSGEPGTLLHRLAADVEVRNDVLTLHPVPGTPGHLHLLDLIGPDELLHEGELETPAELHHQHPHACLLGLRKARARRVHERDPTARRIVVHVRHRLWEPRRGGDEHL